MSAKCGTTAGYKAHWKLKEPACQPCKNAMAAYQRSRPSRSEYHKDYYQKHADYLREQSAQWYAANRERAAATNAARRKAAPEMHRENNRQWRANNIEKARASANNWRKRNPDKAREVERRRRARINGGSPYTEADVLATYGTDCHICGDPVDMSAPRKIGTDGWRRGLHIDHVVPIAKGGADSLENVRPSHGACNITKGAS